jgi:hypothetical protein
VSSAIPCKFPSAVPHPERSDAKRTPNQPFAWGETTAPTMSEGQIAPQLNSVRRHYKIGVIWPFANLRRKEPPLQFSGSSHIARVSLRNR